MLAQELAEAANLDLAEAPEIHYAPRRAWYALLIFEIQILASGIDLAIVTLLVHPIETAFRINDVGFAAISAIPMAVGIGIAYYPAGVFADTFRRRDMIAVGCLVWAIGAAVASRSNSGTMLFFARLLAGIGTGIPGPAIISMLSDAFSKKIRALAVSVYLAGAAIGNGLGLAVCGTFVAFTQHNGTLRLGGIIFLPWQQCFILCTGIGVITSALAMTILEPPRTEKSAHAHPSLISTLRVFYQYLGRHRLLWTLMLVGYTINLTSLYGILAWGPAFGMRHFGASGVGAIALLGTFTAAGSLVGSIGGGLLIQHGVSHGSSRVLPRMLVAVGVVACLFAGSFPYMPSWLLVVIGVGGVYATVSGLATLLIIAIQECTPNEVRGQLVGIVGVVAIIPQIIGATVVAFLATNVFSSTGGLQPALAVVGTVASISAVLMFAFSGPPYERARNELRAMIARNTPEKQG